MNGTRNSLSKNAPPLHFERAYIKITFCGKWSIFANHVTYVFQPSPLVLCMQNSAFRTRITSLCRWIDPTCGFCRQNSVFWTRITSLYGSQTSLVVCECSTAWLASEILVSMGPNPYLWFLHANQRLLEQNYKSLLVPDMTCRFVHAKQRDKHQNY